MAKFLKEKQTRAITFKMTQTFMNGVEALAKDMKVTNLSECAKRSIIEEAKRRKIVIQH